MREMKKYLKFCLFGLLATSIFSYSYASPGYSKIFTLERTLNSNQVVYEANLSSVDYPIHPYWNMRAEDGHTEELNRIERNRAYGVEIIKQSATEVDFAIVAFRSHPVKVRLDAVSKTPYATITLSSGEKILTDIYLTVTGSIFPSVSKIEISYQNAKDGPVLHESFDPNAE